MFRLIYRLIALVFLVLVGLSLVIPQVSKVIVLGTVHHSPESIKNLAKVKEGSAFLWVNSIRLRELVNDPWIVHARVIRQWPDTILIEITERQAVLTFQGQAYAIDGTLLPDATELLKRSLIPVEGWGPARLDEAIALIQLLANHHPKMLSYSPAGFRVHLAETEVTTPSVQALQTHWSSFLSQQGSRAYVYPWGVSATNE